MQLRPLGTTGLNVSEIGFGAWGIGASAWIGAQEDESVAALHRAIELGVNFVDTARGYGESERIVGAVLRDHPEVLVATKVPPKNGVWPAPDGLHPDETFPGEHIRRAWRRASPRPVGRRSTSCSSTSGATTGSAGATGWRRSTTSGARARSGSSASRSTTTSRRTPSPSCAAARSTRCR